VNAGKPVPGTDYKLVY